MARESFENSQTAKLLNEHFVNVKVDREERPDVDRFCNALSGDAAQALAAMGPIQGRPTLYLCENFTCRAPVTSPEDMRQLLDRIPEKSLD